MHRLAKDGLNVGRPQRFKSLNTWDLIGNPGWGVKELWGCEVAESVSLRAGFENL